MTSDDTPAAKPLGMLVKVDGEWRLMPFDHATKEELAGWKIARRSPMSDTPPDTFWCMTGCELTAPCKPMTCKKAGIFEAPDDVALRARLAPMPDTDAQPCARCTLPRREHHHSGAAYGVCGEFVDRSADTLDLSRRRRRHDGRAQKGEAR